MFSLKKKDKMFHSADGYVCNFIEKFLWVCDLSIIFRHLVMTVETDWKLPNGNETKTLKH